MNIKKDIIKHPNVDAYKSKLKNCVKYGENKMKYYNIGDDIMTI